MNIQLIFKLVSNNNNPNIPNKNLISKLTNYRNEMKDNPDDETIFKRSGRNGIIRNKKDREQLKGFNCELCQEVKNLKISILNK